MADNITNKISQYPEVLRQEIETYYEKQQELTKSNLNKYVLIKGKEIVDTFQSKKDAIKQGYIRFKNSPFLVKKIEQVEPPLNFTTNMIGG